jgi:DNA-binding response OmpR family regulator
MQKIMIKKIRKFSNMTVLCITNNADLILDIQNQFSDAKNLLFLSTTESLENEEKPYDILLIDYELEDSLIVLKTMKMLKPMLPKIVILKDATEEDLVNCINYEAYSILAYPLEYNDLRLSMVMALNQSKRVDKLCLNHGLYYDDYRERFYNENGAISFTRLEFDLLKLLLDNHNQIIDYDVIKEKVWKEKKMSIFTMRNVVNKIRNKTYYDVIKNNSSSGYQIDTIK